MLILNYLKNLKYVHTIIINFKIFFCDNKSQHIFKIKNLLRRLWYEELILVTLENL
jgi:hypothetical protein